MRLCSIILLHIGFSLSVLIREDEVEINVLEKVNHTTFVDRPIAISTHSFPDFVMQSDALVDKSLLIKYLLEKDDKISFISVPRKWGKTMNLGMLRRFIELDADRRGRPRPPEEQWNYRYFVHGEVIDWRFHIQKLKGPPLISKHQDIIDKHMNKHSVIYLDVMLAHEERAWHNEKFDFVEGMKMIVLELYQHHFYVGKKMYQIVDNYDLPVELRTEVENDLNEFDKYAKDKYTVEELPFCVKFLCKMLQKYMNTTVWIMIDDFDLLVNTINYQPKPNMDTKIHFPVGVTKNAQKIIIEEPDVFFSRFLHYTFLENEYYSRAVITGIHSVSLADLCPGLTNVTYYTMMHNELYPFYGFTPAEADEIYNIFKVPKKMIKPAHNFYSGFHTMNNPTLPMYCPWSVVKSTSNKKLGPYWLKSKPVPIFLYFSKFKDIFTEIEALLQDKEVIIYRSNIVFDNGDIEIIKKLLTNDKALVFDHRTIATAFSFLISAGYLTMGNKTLLDDKGVARAFQVVIPNKEIRNHIIEDLKIRYGNASDERIHTRRRAKHRIWTRVGKMGPFVI